MKPTVGDYFTTPRLGLVQIVRVRDFGTYDVRAVETDRYYRITGMPMAALYSIEPAPGSNERPTTWSSAVLQAGAL